MAMINGTSFIGTTVTVDSMEAIKELANDIKNILTDAVVVLTANIDGKAAVGIALSDSIHASKGLDANKLIKEHIAPLIKRWWRWPENTCQRRCGVTNGLPAAIEAIKALL